MNASELARANTAAILQAMAKTGQARIADQLGCSESTISRYKDAEVERFGAILAACSLRVVHRDDPYVPEARLNALTILAREALDAAGWNVAR